MQVVKRGARDRAQGLWGWLRVGGANPHLNPFAVYVGLEPTYKAQLTDWLYVQPDVQYVINPGLSPDRDAALVLGMRLVVRR